MRSVGGTRQGDGVGRWGGGFFFFLLSRFQVFTIDDVLSAGFGILTVSVRVSYGLYEEKKEDATLRVKDRPDRKAVKHCTGNVVIIIIINRIDFYFFSCFFPPFLSEVS